MSSCSVEFNAPRDTRYAHTDERFASTLHVFAREWHGIRSATACLPGLKLAVPHERALTGLELHAIEGLISRFRVGSVIYQGYSPTVDGLAKIISTNFGVQVRQFAVTHVSPPQFEHLFELEMLGLLRSALANGVLTAVASVKPGFWKSVAFVRPATIFNCAPTLNPGSSLPGCSDYALVPIENSWRKNLYVNVLAALASNARRILCVNEPSRLGEVVEQLDRVAVIGWHSPQELWEIMRSAACVMNVTVTECQPMMQLESLAVGTPCLTGRLGIKELSDHEITRLTEVSVLDDPARIGAQIDVILQRRRADEAGLQAGISDYLRERLKLCIQSYERLLS